MKKFFLFAAAAVAAMTVNAKVVSFAGIVDKESEDGAKSSVATACTLTNITLGAEQNTNKTAWCAVINQTSGTEAWDVTKLVLKTDNQVYITFKDAQDNKKAAKFWAEYIQPNGGGLCLVITGVKSGDKVFVNLKEALSAEPVVEGATGTFDGATAVELTASANEIRIYSKDADGGQVKWKLVSVEVPDGGQGINNTNATVKVEKFYRDGQLIIRKNGVEYNALGARL